MVEYYRNMEYYQNQKLDVGYKAVQCNPTCIYPLETLIVVPDQKVSKEKLSKFGIDKKIKKLSAQQRYEAILKQVKNMELNNVITKAFGIEVSSEMIKVEYFQLPPPSIIAGDNQQIKLKSNGSFNFYNNKYYQTSSIENLVIYDCSEKWKNMLQNELKNMKINVKNIKRENGPSDIRSFEEWKKKLANINPAKDYVIVITETQEIHDLLEFVKIKTGIKIQHILENTTYKKCIPNIVHKLNIRAGGFNWKINFEAGKLDLNSSTRHKIIIGTDVCRPYSKNKSNKNLINKAACVGISHNSHFNPFGFETKLFYQNPGQEIIDTSNTANLFLQNITEILEDFSSNKEADIIYIRDGVSETQYLDIINFEIPILKKAAEEYFGLTKFKILALIVTKTGNTRFFDTSQKVKNLPPRSVITLGNRDIYEQFHLIPHFVDSKYSTTKPLMITILKNEIEAEIKGIQQFLIALCNLHQSNCGPIGLPAPIFLADKIAYKGHRMLAAYEKYIPKEDRIKEDGESFHNLLTLSIMKRSEGEERQQPQQHQH